MIEYSDKHREFLASEGHSIILGGPGSGKTTAALQKAGSISTAGELLHGQKVLFLSFARSTISRLQEHATSILSADSRGDLVTSTYHAFCWSIIRSNAYLMLNRMDVSLLPPSQAAAMLSAMKDFGERQNKKQSLFEQQGIVHFDLFAPVAAELLRRSNVLRTQLSDLYPIIIVDEFQDTDPNEWELIRQLGKESRIIALGDEDQRIYEFRGASPERIPAFIQAFQPQQYHFHTTNYRSPNTDIATFGSDILVGRVGVGDYADVKVTKYPPRSGTAVHMFVKTELLHRARLLRKNQSAWSIAVLVPTKQLVTDVSEYLYAEQTFRAGKSKLPIMRHEVSFEADGANLAVSAVAIFLQGAVSDEVLTQNVLKAVCSHILGRRGEAKSPTLDDINLVDGVAPYLIGETVRGAKRIDLVKSCEALVLSRRKMVFTGDPLPDWKSVLNHFAASSSKVLQLIGKDAAYLNPMRQNSPLNRRIAELWLRLGSYIGAKDLIESALVQDALFVPQRTPAGIYVMTLHKSKGKEFDEVILYEGHHSSRFVNDGDANLRIQSLRAFHVGVTRAKRRVSIFTPEQDPCSVFL